MRSTRRASRLAALFAVVALAATACSGETTTEEDVASEGQSTSEAAGGDTETSTDTGGDTGGGDSDVLVVGTTEKPSTIDPAEVYEKMASDFLFNATDRLIELEPGTGDPVPGVAEDYEVSDDALTYTFTLREGVTFQDGSDLTSEDVKWSLERTTNIAHPDGASFLLGGVESIEAPDDTTVEITLGAPDVTFLSKLAYTTGTILPSDSDVYAAPDAALDEPSAEEAGEFITGDTIVGSGAYQMTDYSPDQGATFETWDGYWGEAPAIPTVRVQFFETTAQMANALRNGEIDMNINDFGPAERSALEGTDGIAVEQGEGGRIRYVVLDVSQAPHDDPAVNRAMSASIDRQRIIDEVFEGVGTPLYSMVPPAYEASQDYMSDIEAEIDGPVDVELWYPLNKYGDTEPDVAETIARSMNETGLFNVTTQSSDWAAEYSGNLNTGAYKAYLLGWYPDYIDPDDYISPFYASSGFIGFYQDEEMDQLITDEQAETDAAARTEIFDQIQQKAAEDMPLIPLYEESFTSYATDDLSGVENSVDIAGQARWYMISR
jgi:peptide/nickel transport system substrate-binding protein